MKGRIAKLHLISKKGGKSEAVLFEFLQKYESAGKHFELFKKNCADNFHVMSFSEIQIIMTFHLIFPIKFQQRVQEV